MRMTQRISTSFFCAFVVLWSGRAIIYIVCSNNDPRFSFGRQKAKIVPRNYHCWHDSNLGIPIKEKLFYIENDVMSVGHFIGIS